MKEQIADGRVWFGRDGNGVPRIKKFLHEARNGLTPNTLWLAEQVGTNDSAKKHTIRLFEGAEVFDTPKPETLVQRILEIATNPGDLVLDSFLGSGTTAAVAHKMGRRWIGIEMGGHAVTHCAPRLRKVIEGEQGGVSGRVGWQGGGGFRFYRLGPTVFDEEGQVRRDIRFPVLAAHVWFSETGRPWRGSGAAAAGEGSPVLGVHDGHAYALLYNGVLGDRRPRGGNVLTRATGHGRVRHLTARRHRRPAEPRRRNADRCAWGSRVVRPARRASPAARLPLLRRPGPRPASEPTEDAPDGPRGWGRPHPARRASRPERR